MAAWSDLEREKPEMAEAGKRRLIGDDGVAIGFLATVTADGQSNLAPVCPVFCDDHLYLIAATQTPKARDLANNGQFTLHAFLGDNDEEFQCSGKAPVVEREDERERVHRAVPFASFGVDDPVFRLELHRAVWAYWERPGEVDTKQVKHSWRHS